MIRLMESMMVMDMIMGIMMTRHESPIQFEMGAMVFSMWLFLSSVLFTAVSKYQTSKDDFETYRYICMCE